MDLKPPKFKFAKDLTHEISLTKDEFRGKFTITKAFVGNQYAKTQTDRSRTRNIGDFMAARMGNRPHDIREFEPRPADGLYHNVKAYPDHV